MTGRVTEIAAVTGLAVALTVAVAFPVLRAPSERIFGRETVGRHHDPFTVMERSRLPFADIVRGIYAQPFTDIPGALLERASGPVAAYNWLVLLTFPLSAAAAYLLARHLTLAPAAATIAALAFAFSPFHLAHAAYHPQIAQTQWVPLYLLLLWRCLDDATVTAVGLLAMGIAGVTLSNFYGGLIAAAITPVALPAYWLVTSRRRPGSLRHLAITIATLVVVACAGIGYAWYAAHGAMADPADFAFMRADLFRYSAKWWSYLVPPVANPLVGGVAERAWAGAGVDAGLLEQQVSLGWGVIALGLVAIAAWSTTRRPSTSLAVVPTLAIVAAAAVICSLSPERAIGAFTFTRPAALLYRVVPMFRSYARFGVVVQLMATLLAGIGAERLWRIGTARARIACAALLALAAVEYVVVPSAMSRDVLPTMAHRSVMREAGRVQALDCAPVTPESESIQWLTGYRITLAQGAFDDCAEPNLAGKLAAAGYTNLIVRRDTPSGRWFVAHPPADGLQMTAHFVDADVFAVTASAPLVYTSELTGFDARETDGLWSWRWMGSSASWAVVNRSDRPLVAFLDVEMTAFHSARRLTVRLDDVETQMVIVEERRGVVRIGPLGLTPGRHALVFQPVDAPSVADVFLHNGDRRAVAFAFGAWRWTIDGELP